MLLAAECTLYRGQVHRNLGLEIDRRGILAAIAPLAELGPPDLYLPGRLLMPGMVSAHGEASLRLLRGRAPAASLGTADLPRQKRDQERAHYLMTCLTPAQLQATAEQVFIEMLLCGVTSAGEVLLVQDAAAPTAAAGPSPFAMADALLRAAQRTGMRLSLIFTVALKGVALPPHVGARSLDAACQSFDALIDHILSYRDPRLGWALGIHSLGALPLDALIGLKVRLGHMPLHLPVSQHPVELQTSQLLHRQSPIALLVDAEICDSCVTLIDTRHGKPEEFAALGRTGAQVALGAVGTERGEQTRQAVQQWQRCGIPACLSQDARRGGSLLAAAHYLGQQPDELADPAALWRAATQHGATALGAPTGQLAPNHWADLVAIDLGAPSLAGLADALLLPALMFDIGELPVSEVFVAGQPVVSEGRHPQAQAIAQAYGRTASEVFPA